jgi:hypothetical protein
MRSVTGKRGTFKEDLEEELSVTDLEIMLYKCGIDDREKVAHKMPTVLQRQGQRCSK